MGRLFSSRVVAAGCLVALALAGCGKKGPLEPPPFSPQAQVRQNPAAAEAAQTRILDDRDAPGLIQPPDTIYQQPAIAQLNSSVRNPARPINAPPLNQPSTFILDPLVK